MLAVFLFSFILWLAGTALLLRALKQVTRVPWWERTALELEKLTALRTRVHTSHRRTKHLDSQP